MEPFCQNYTQPDTVDNANGHVHLLSADSSPEDTYRAVAGCILFASVLPFVLFEFRRFPIGTTGAVLVGACLMVIFQIISQDEALAVLGARSNITTIFLLLGMMILAQYFDRERLLDRLLCLIMPMQVSFWKLVLLICSLSFIVSALFTNDVCCAALTPILLRYWNGKKQPQMKVELVLLAIATSSNIGSVITIFGNPQMALIAAHTASPGYAAMRLNLRTCFTYLLPPAVVVCFLNFLALMLFHSLRMRGARKNQLKSQKENDSLLMQSVGVTNNVIRVQSTLAVDSDAALSSDERSAGHVSTPDDETTVHPLTDTPSGADHNETLQQNKSRETITGISTELTDRRIVYKTNSKIFTAVVVILVVTVIALFFASTEEVPFEMGTVPMCAAVIAMVVDASLNHQSPHAILKDVDWNILLLFFGFFVWLHGLNKTAVPNLVWWHLGFDSDSSNQAVNSSTTLAKFCLFVVIGSNVFSNVPLTIIVLELLKPCSSVNGQLTLVLLLAWAATIAGNLTLFGSVANLIVSQKAAESVGYRLTFWLHLQYSFVTTLLFTALGVLIIIGLQLALGTF